MPPPLQRYTAAQLQVLINNNGIASPPQDDLDAHWAAVRAGGAGLISVSTWMSQLTALYPTTAQVLGRSNHRIGVKLPEGWGRNREVIVMVGGVPSNITRFTYLPVSASFVPVCATAVCWVDGVHCCSSLCVVLRR